MMLKPNILSQQVVYQNKWIVLKKDLCLDKHGVETEYTYIENNGGVIIVPILQNGQLVLISQFRYLLGRLSIEFPAGAIEAQHDALHTAQKELVEETGWVAEDFIFIGTFEPAPGRMKNTMSVYLAHVSEQGEQMLEDTEEIEVMYRRPDQFEEMIQRGEIVDGVTLSAWQMVRTFVLRSQDQDE